MSDRLELTIDLGPLRRICAVTREAMDDETLFDEAGDWMAKTYLREVLSEGVAPAPLRGDKGLYDAGNLAGGFFYEAEPKTLSIQNKFSWAWVHDEGETITAKNGVGLRVPTQAVLALGASKRRTATPKDFPEGFYVHKKDGTVFFGRVKGTKTKTVKGQRKKVGLAKAKRAAKKAGAKLEIEALFVYKQSVTMPRRRFMVWTPDAREGVRDRVQGVVLAKIAKAGGK